MKMSRVFVYNVVAGMAIVLVLALDGRASANSTGGAEEISALLSNAKTEAVELRHDAEVMESFTRSHVSWQSFANKVTQSKEHLNRTGQLTSQLQRAREGAAPWQQQAIDHTAPPLQELAEKVQTTIQFLSDHPERVHSPEFEEYCKLNYELASDLEAVIGEFVKYGETQAKLAELEKTIRER